MTRSKPATLTAASTSGSAALISLPKSRVASERMKTRGRRGAAPSSDRPRARSRSCGSGRRGARRRSCRRDGSMLITAMRSASFWSRRRRRISSSVRLDLPAPPVPVMPTTGVLASRAACVIGSRSAGVAAPLSSAVISRASARRAASSWPRDRRQRRRRVRRQVDVAAHHHLADHPGQAHPLPVLRAVDALDAVVMQLGDLARRRSRRRRRRRPGSSSPPRALSRSTMYLKYSTWPPWYELIAMPCTSSCSAAVTTSSTERLWPRWITSAPIALQDAPHDVDRRVVAVEQRRGGDEAHLVPRPVVGERLVFGGELGHARSS